MMMTAPVQKQGDAKLAKREAFAEVARKMDSLAVAAQDAFAIKGNFERTFALGTAMADLREVLDDKVMQSIMKLQNTKLGFRTDMERGYPVHVVRDAVIEATVWGLQCVGNQFNIISGGFYATKEGYTYLLRNMPGLEDMRFIYHPAVISESSTSGRRKDGTEYQKIEREGMTRVDVSWVFRGKREAERLEFCIRVNAGMSQDAIIGKAERKAKRWLFERLTDRQLPDASADDLDVIDVQGAGVPQDKPLARKAGIQASRPVMTAEVEAEAVSQAATLPDERLHPELHADEDEDVFAGMWPDAEDEM